MSADSVDAVDSVLHSDLLSKLGPLSTPELFQQLHDE